MTILELLLLAVALSLDTLAVAVSIAMCSGSYTTFQKNRYVFTISIFHVVMPIIGWLLGSSIYNLVTGFDHWIVFVLLSFIAGKMIYEGIDTEEKNCGECKDSDISKYFSLSGGVLFGLALSIDAIVAGFACSLLEINIFNNISQFFNMLIASLIIGVVAFLFTDVGIKVGKFVGAKIGKKSSIFGGLVLFGIAVKTLLEHLL